MHQPRPIRRFSLLLVPLLALIAVALCSAVLAPSAKALVSAGGGFHFQGTQSFGWAVSSLTFRTADDLWAVTNNTYGSQLVHSPDAGETWQAVDTGLDFEGYLDGFTFFDGLHARATVALSTNKDLTAKLGLVKSDDGGATWSLTPLAISNLEPWDTCFASKDRVVISGKQRNPTTGIWSMVMFTSMDGGATWTRRPLPVPYAYDVQTRDMRHFWLYEYNEGHHPSVFTSADGGATWKERALPSCTYTEWDLKAVDAGHAWISIMRTAKPHNLIYSTADGGRTWQRRVTFPGYGGGSVTPVSASEAWLTGGNGGGIPRDLSCYVEHTNDGGKTWTRHYVGPRGAGGIVVSPDGTLLARGNGVWRSRDEGATWTRLVGDRLDYWLNDVVAAPDGSLWSVGRSTPFAPGIEGDDDLGVGLLYQCTDGATWRQVEIPDVKPLRTLDVAGDSAIWAGGWDGAAIRSADGGATWSSCGVDPALYFEDLLALDAQSAFAIVYDEAHSLSSVLHTTDGGAHWDVVARGGDKDILRRICRLGPNHLLIAGVRYGLPRQAVLLESTDGGDSWSDRALACKRSLRDMVFTDADHGWIVASDDSALGYLSDYGSLVLRTADGGQTWETTDLGKLSMNGFVRVAFADARHGWVLGDKIFETADGGASWTDTGAAVPDSVLGGAFGQSEIRGAVTVGGQLWAVGADQLILSTVDTEGDAAPPLTSDDGDRLWHNAAVATHLFAADPGGSGVAGTEYRTDGGPWQPVEAGVISVDAPADHSGDGTHKVEYRSTDVAGNVEFPQVLMVRLDTNAPTTAAGSATVRRGKGATLPFTVSDAEPNGGAATVRITIRTNRGELAKRLFLGEQQVNKKTTVTFICHLLVGSYSYAVTAVDQAGNSQASIGRGKLIVTR